MCLQYKLESKEAVVTLRNEAVRLVEDSLSPLARANSQISESIAQLEKSLLTLKAATFAETPNSD